MRLSNTSALGALLLSGAVSAQAATLLVTTPNDSHDGQCNLHCSLRDAVTVANQSANPDLILLFPGTYTLSLPAALDGNGVPIDDDDNPIGDLDILGDLRIRGLSSTGSRIKGQFNDRLIEVRPGARLRLERLTLEGGNSAHNGGAVENHGSLRLHKVLLQNNQAVTTPPQVPPDQAFSHGQGGAIANHGDLTITASRLQFNNAQGSGNGNDNTGRGGALFNRGTLLVRDSLFYQNAAFDLGDNGAGAALYNLGQARLERSSVIDHGHPELAEGGAITNRNGELNLVNSSMSQNGAVLTNGFLDDPAGPRAKATLTNVTMTANAGYAILNWSDLLVRNSILAGNLDPYSDQPANCINLRDNFSYLAIGLLRNDESSNCGADLFVPFAQTFTQVLSATLSKPSGTLWFHALLPGSPAVDAGIGDCSAQDQRGVSRPQDGDGDGVAVCDLGAYELKP